jgi:ATP-dependent DNA ligase
MTKAVTANFSFIEPMKAMKVNDLPAGNWLYEIKFDGYRALAIKVDNEVRLISRNRKSFNDDYPVLLDSVKSLKTKSFTIDGEITALDENGRSSFQLLQGYGKAKHTPLVYYTFDLLSLDGADLRSRPLIERRKLLAAAQKCSGEYQILRGANWYKGRASPGSKAVSARRPDRKKTRFSVRAWPALRRLGQSQAYPAARVRHRRLHTA